MTADCGLRTSDFRTRLEGFNLQDTLSGGQAFRWLPTEDPQVMVGVVQGAQWQVSWMPPEFTVVCLSPESQRQPAADFARAYFDLDRNYQTALDRLRRDERFAGFTEAVTGIRLLRQDWFETLISFVVSANNHIRRISRIIESLCSHYGTRLEGNQGVFYAFPSPQQLAAARVEDLRRNCNAGYRDQFIQSIAERIAADHTDWQQAESWDFEPLRGRLLELPGVGPKVADCILLFGFGRWEAFPIDTWVRQAFTQLYFSGKSPTDRALREFGREHFGNLAGLAQQYLFEAARKKS